jgi:hypothetical protein
MSSFKCIALLTSPSLIWAGPVPRPSWVVSEPQDPWVPLPISPPGVQPEAKSQLFPMDLPQKMTYFCGYML